MTTKEIQEITLKLNKKVWNKWDCQSGASGTIIKIWYNPITYNEYNNRMEVYVCLIGKYKELLNKYSEDELNKYIIEYISCYYNNKIKIFPCEHKDNIFSDKSNKIIE